MVTRTKKIFVGGLSAPSTLEDVKNYFEQFGRVRTFNIVTLDFYCINITSFKNFQNNKHTKHLVYIQTDYYFLISDWRCNADVWQTDKQTQVCFDNKLTFLRPLVAIRNILNLLLFSHSWLRFIHVPQAFVYFKNLLHCVNSL